MRQISHRATECKVDPRHSHLQVDTRHCQRFDLDTRHSDPPSWALQVVGRVCKWSSIPINAIKPDLIGNKSLILHCPQVTLLREVRQARNSFPVSNCTEKKRRKWLSWRVIFKNRLSFVEESLFSLHNHFWRKKLYPWKESGFHMESQIGPF